MESQVRRTKIIATLGPATDAPGMLKQIIAEGVDVVRLNLSHGKAEDHQRRAKEAREAAAELGKEVAVLADLQGPKIRIEKFLNGPVILESGQAFDLDCRAEAPPGDTSRIGVSYLNLYNDVKSDDVLLLDDGLISLHVDKVEGTTIHTTVLAGGVISDRKGINRQGGGLSLTALSEKDKNDIKVAAQLNADFLAVSFVKSAADIEESRKLMRAAGGSAAMVAKIERSEAIESVVLAGIIDASDAVMVARGDLGVEIGDAELPGIQKKIIRETLARNKVVITATQMMQSMVESPIPTRAEVLDVANAVLDGTDAVMLSGETASGKHPDKAVAAMRRVCEGAERQFEPKENYNFSRRLDRVDQAVSLAAIFMTGHIGVRAIIALTESGGTAQWLSRYRSRVPIYALSRRQGARRRMMLYRDVTPIAFDPMGVDANHAAFAAVQHMFNMNCLAEGDRVILTTGDHTGQHGGTNTLKLLRVGPGGVAEGLGDL